MNDGTYDNLNRGTPGGAGGSGGSGGGPGHGGLDGSADRAPDAAPELESLLREWHAQNASRAAAGRDRLLASLRSQGVALKDDASTLPASSPAASQPNAAPKLNLPSLMDEIEREPASKPPAKQHSGGTRSVLGRIFMHRYSPLAAATLALASVMTYFVANSLNHTPRIDGPGVAIKNAIDREENLRLIQKACDDRYVMAPHGGRLDAVDGLGNVMGPCILKHTDVDVQVSGFLSRVSVKQIYVNPHSTKVETVYTFPLSERAAVDRMKMTIGNREIEGQVKERAEAQRIYQEAKAQGRIASLLEQERPNIFTQSIANIEPQAQIAIEISYVEVLQQRDGEYSFSFPTTIAPRYIPGEMRTWEMNPPPAPAVKPPALNLPPGFVPRRGIVLIGPAQLVEMQPGDTSKATLTTADLGRELGRARAVRPLPGSGGGTVWYNFTVKYDDGSKETGSLYTNGTGTVNNRWFYSAELASIGSEVPVAIPDLDGGARPFPLPPGRTPEHEGAGPEYYGGRAEVGSTGQPGDNFSPPTTSVPDANRITPMPVSPDRRAGHDISITVHIDSGGPSVTDIKSALHTIDVNPGDVDAARRVVNGPVEASRKTITLRNLNEIPNRDFSLSWKMAGGLDQPVVLTHTAPQGNFFFVSVLPPERADDTIAVPREITFVLDRSGSMKGFKIEQAKAIIDATLATMRPYDTFNVLGFSSTFETLWSSPRRATAENIAEARAFYGRNEGSGATEMLKVVSAALAPSTGAAGQPVALAPVAISPEDLANLAADGRTVIVDVPSDRLLNLDDQGNERLPNRSIKMNNGAPDLKVRIRNRLFAIVAPSLRLVGAWVTENGERILSVTQVDAGDVPTELTVADLLNLPADDRAVTVTVIPSSVEEPAPDDGQIHAPPPTRCWRIRDYSGHEVEMLNASGIKPLARSEAGLKGVCYRVKGRWGTLNGRRLFAVDSATRGLVNDQVAVVPVTPAPSAKPLRIVAFITDGEVGNDMEVLAAIRRHRGDARVFSFAIGNSPNRYLLDGMARLGRGEVDYVPLNADPAEIIKRFTNRVTNPVLTDIKVQFSPNIQPVDVLTALGGGAGERVSNADFIPDLYDQKPVIIVGRYNAAGAGSITLSGNAAGGPWTKTINVNLPATEPRNSTIATLWARTKVESIMDDSLTSIQRGSLNPEQRNAIVSLGESFSLVTQFTSFVAVDRLRVTIDGKSRLVQIPIEFPQGDEWSGYFGTPPGDRSDLTKLMILGGHISTEITDDAALNFVNSRGFYPTGFIQESLGLTSTLADGDAARSVNLLYNAADTQAVIDQVIASATLNSFEVRDAEHFGLALNHPSGNPSDNLGAYRMSGGAQLDVSGAATRYNLPALQPSTGTPGAPRADAATIIRRDVSPRPGDAGTTVLRAEREQAGAPKPGSTGDRARGAEAGRDALPAKAAPPAPGASPSPAPSEGSRVKGLEDAWSGSAVGRKSADESKDAAKDKKLSPADPGERREERSKSPAPASEAEKVAPRQKELPLPPSGGSGPGGSSSAPPPPVPAPSAAPAPPAPPAPSSPEAARMPASSAIPDAPAPAKNEVAESAPVSSLDTLRTLVFTAQLAPNDVDRLGKIEPSNAADQKLIDAYVAEADSVARVVESLKAKALAKAVDQNADALTEPVPAAETKSGFDSSTGPGEPAAGTSHEASKTGAAASTPASASTPIKPVARLVRAEEVAMHIASLAKRNKLDEARTWAVAFADVAKENDIAQEMRGVFSDDTLKDDVRVAKLVELGRQAATRLATLIRENRIRTVMQPELASIALDANYKGGFPEGATKVNGGLLVSLVVQALGDDTFKALRAAGLAIEMSDTDTRVVIGTVALDHLDDLALVPSVNRIEMTK